MTKKILKKNKCFDCGRTYVVPVKESKELKNMRCSKCNKEADSLLLKKKKK